MNHINIYNLLDEDCVSYPYQSIIFPGGEPHVRIDPPYIKDQNIWIDARLGDTNGFMTLIMLIDAIKACKPKKLGLFIPYFPGARQDRREEGGAFSLKIYADIIASMKLDAIVTLDPHSIILSSMLNIYTPDLEYIVHDYHSYAYDGIICPDAGAEKRAREFAEHIKCENIVFCHKTRNPNTGKLSNFIAPDIETGLYLVVDDICDGGATFLGLADAIHVKNPAVVLNLYVSHGIFSKGLDELKKRYNKIYSTDSFPGTEKVDGITFGVHKVFWAAETKMRQILLP